MDQYSENLSKADIQKAMQLAQTDAAKQLFAMLKANNSDQLNDAMNQAAAGDMTGARNALQQLLSSEQAQQLLRQLQGG